MISALSRVTTGLGNPAGATMPHQVVMLKSGMPASATVCTLGNKGERVVPVVAMMSTAPDFTYCSMVGNVAKNAWVRPARKSTVAGPLPLYGTWVSFAPVFWMNSSPARWVTLPAPDEQKSRPSGFFFVASTNSATFLTPKPLVVTIINGPRPIMAIGVKSFFTSYDALVSVAAWVTKVEVTKSSVWPSGSARATVLAAMAPPPPPRLSTTTGWPSFSDRYLASSRAMLSVPPPAENGTTSVIGRFG